jgi:hypothetical protein
MCAIMRPLKAVAFVRDSQHLLCSANTTPQSLCAHKQHIQTESTARVPFTSHHAAIMQAQRVLVLLGACMSTECTFMRARMSGSGVRCRLFS